MNASADFDKPSAAKVDAPLRSAYAAATSTPQDGGTLATLANVIQLRIDGDGVTVGILLRASATDDELRAAGFVVTSRIAGIVAGSMVIQRLPNLAALAGVDRIEASTRLRPSAP